MLNTQTVALGVDLTKTDDRLMKFVQFFGEKLSVNRLHLIHVMPSFLSPGNADLELHQIFAPGFSLKGKIEEEISNTTSSIFQKGIITEVEVLEGNPYDELMNRAEDLGAGLVVIGRKIKSDGSGITAQRIARKFQGNVLLVPEETSLNIHRITVPIDFSNNSSRALIAALDLAEKINNCSVRCVHIVNAAPDNYYLDLKSRTQIDSHLRLNAENAWNTFLGKNGWKDDLVPITYLQNFNESTSVMLNDFFKSQHSDFVIMGAKGHTAFEHFLFGSVTEQLVDTWEGSPILVVR